MTRPDASWVHDYYSGNWDEILHYNGKADVGGAPGGSGSSAPSGDVSELAERIITGEFGNGNARRAALGSRYGEVQAEVNRIQLGGGSGIDVDAMARRGLVGEFGNGDERKRRLSSNYDAVQRRVSEILLGAGSSSSSMNVDAMAKAVIRDDYGNGERAQAAPRLLLLDRAVVCERDAVMRCRLAFIADQVGWLLGDVACFLLLILFLPPVPVLKMFEGIRDRHEDE